MELNEVRKAILIIFANILNRRNRMFMLQPKPQPPVPFYPKLLQSLQSRSGDGTHSSMPSARRRPFYETTLHYLSANLVTDRVLRMSYSHWDYLLDYSTNVGGEIPTQHQPYSISRRASRGSRFVRRHAPYATSDTLAKS